VCGLGRHRLQRRGRAARRRRRRAADAAAARRRAAPPLGVGVERQLVVAVDRAALVGQVKQPRLECARRHVVAERRAAAARRRPRQRRGRHGFAGEPVDRRELLVAERALAQARVVDGGEVALAQLAAQLEEALELAHRLARAQARRERVGRAAARRCARPADARNGCVVGRGGGRVEIHRGGEVVLGHRPQRRLDLCERHGELGREVDVQLARGVIAADPVDHGARRGRGRAEGGREEGQVEEGIDGRLAREGLVGRQREALGRLDVFVKVGVAQPPHIAVARNAVRRLADEGGAAGAELAVGEAELPKRRLVRD
jgi:hypothetical protein